MEWVPVASEEMLVVALPAASTLTVPTATPSAKKVTVPVGIPPLLVTLAVRATEVVTTAGFGLAVTAMALVAIWTTNGTAGAILPASFKSPEYVATME